MLEENQTKTYKAIRGRRRPAVLQVDIAWGCKLYAVLTLAEQRQTAALFVKIP